MSICPLVTLIFPDAHSPVSSVVRSLVDLRCLCFFFFYLQSACFAEVFFGQSTSENDSTAEPN